MRRGGQTPRPVILYNKYVNTRTVYIPYKYPTRQGQARGGQGRGSLVDRRADSPPGPAQKVRQVQLGEEGRD